MSEKYSLHLEGLTLEALAKVVLALKGSTATVAGSGAATPQAAPAPAPTYAAPAAPQQAAAAPVAATAPAPVPTTATSPSNGGALTFEVDVMTAFKTNLARIKAPGVAAVNAQFGISSPLALKERPQDWAGYIAALAASPSA